MPVKTIRAANGKTYRFGRKAPIAKGPRLRLGNYLMRSLPAPPTSWAENVSAASTVLADILGNDAKGDCTIAAAYHCIAALEAAGGSSVDPLLDAANAVALYLQLTGGQDDGLDEQTVLNWWQQSGLLAGGAHKITAWAAVNGADPVECRAAIYLFGNLYFGVALPDAWINPFPSASGFLWNVAGDPDPNNGHAFPAIGSYTAVGPTIDTWGMHGVITWDAVAKYASAAGGGELYVVLSSETIVQATQKCPSGFDFTQLLADIQSIAP